MAKYFFCGIGGVGMNPLAFILKEQGNEIIGSDRSYKKNYGIYKTIDDANIKVFPQDGSGIDESVDFFIVSTAVEEDNLDYQKALKLGIKIIKRPELLATLINESPKSIAVGGTSGKTTTTGMIGHMLNILNNNPLVINGGIMTNYNQTYLNGNGISVAEADESNGTIELYEPTYSLISNISLDHKSLEELLELFTNFIKKTEKKCVLNADCKFSFGLINDENKDKVVTFGIENDLADFNAYSIKLGAQSSGFSLKGVDFTINMAGIHNIYNALSAVAVLNINGYELESIANALRSFKGIKRRMEFIGSFNEIDVIDDFAHNPDKIANAINSVKPYCEGRLITIFQPHGFAPTRLMKDGYIESFVSTLSKNDIVIMPEIYYAGGQVVRDISAKDLTSEIEKSGIKSYFFENRADILAVLKEIAKPKDKIMVMGARDNSLNEFAKEILEFMEN